MPLFPAGPLIVMHKYSPTPLFFFLNSGKEKKNRSGLLGLDVEAGRGFVPAPCYIRVQTRCYGASLGDTEVSEPPDAIGSRV